MKETLYEKLKQHDKLCKEEINIVQLPTLLGITKVKKQDTETTLSRYILLTDQDSTSFDDINRKALFLIIAGNEELWLLRNSIYNFSERKINVDSLSYDLSIVAKTLLENAFTLYRWLPL